jgi:ABC-type Co2+ transport system permease subunit
MLDFTNPTTVAVTTALLISVFTWMYSKYILKEKDAEKALAKTVLSGLVAVAVVLVVSFNQMGSHSLRSEPFFVSVI